MDGLQQRKDMRTNLNTKLLFLRPTYVDSNVKRLPQKAHNDSLMDAIGPALFIARFFGILPIPNTNSDGKSEDFRWRSFRSIYALLILASLLTAALLSLSRLAVIGVSFQGITNAVFYCNTLAEACIFLRLAMSWKCMAQCWYYVEQDVMVPYGWSNNLSRKTLCMTLFMLTGGLVEFCLAQANNMAKVWSCAKNEGVTHVMRQFFLLKFDMTFYITNYASWKGMIFLLIQAIATFTWNFVDLMIVLISMALSARFRLLNDFIFSCDVQERTSEIWRRVRETYFKLSELTREADRRFGTLVLLSFGGNLCFICSQLMHSVRTQNTSVYYDVYFVFSMIFLALRTFLVAIMAGGIYEESVRPKEVLYNVPTKNCSVEVDRFLMHVCSDQIALTGRRFFAITRSILLTMMGSVVTYEIILVQLNPRTVYDTDNGLVDKNDTLDYCKALKY